MDTGFARALVELFVSFPWGADINTEDGDIHIRVEPLEQHRILDRVHAAKAGAILVIAFVARTHTLDQRQILGHLAI
ncbi:MAG: hypothetical protein BWY63_01749 [Chloroflexi bacterium ADurb.Bin360]|nr:MAG: hypothetical protein BWY63_01749 [Chloroflexi bacterium ADurb.Bin360]